MAKLTKKQKQRLEFSLDHIKRAHEYLMRSDVAVAIRRERATTTLDFVNASGAVLTDVNKEIGSDLAMFASGIEALESFLNAE